MRTRDEWRKHLEALPEPMTGPSPWEAKRAGESEGEEAYQLAAEPVYWT